MTLRLALIAYPLGIAISAWLDGADRPSERRSTCRIAVRAVTWPLRLAAWVVVPT